MAEQLLNALPKNLQWLRRILEKDEDESRPLLIHLLDRLHKGEVSWLQMGVFTGAPEEDLNAYKKLRFLSMVSLLAAQYGARIPLEDQATDYLNHLQVEDLHRELNIPKVSRVLFPIMVEVISVDNEGRESDLLPAEPFPLDVLLAVAQRTMEWYEDSVDGAHALDRRSSTINSEAIRGFIRNTLISAYGLWESEVVLVGETVAMDAVRRHVRAGVATHM